MIRGLRVSKILGGRVYNIKFGFPGPSLVKNPPAMQKGVWSVVQEDALEKEMATHSSVLACKTAWTEELGGLQPMESDTT